jgi:hypothetical protein
VGIIGLGNLGSYFADYIIHRHDIHHGVKVFGYDRHSEARPTSAGDFERCGDTKTVFHNADVVYGCSGEDIGSDATSFGCSGQLLVSLSSGDVEFATLLKSDTMGSKPVVANKGFPITFDGSPSSAPLIEMQVNDIALPEVTQHAIMNYPLPDHQTGQKYSPFTYLHTDATRNLCGTVHNVASPEMLYCSSSSSLPPIFWTQLS